MCIITRTVSLLALHVYRTAFADMFVSYVGESSKNGIIQVLKWDERKAEAGHNILMLLRKDNE